MNEPDSTPAVKPPPQRHLTLAILAASLVLAASAPGPSSRRVEARLEAAWQEALARSGAPRAEVLRPQVVFEESTDRPERMAAEYLPYVNEVRVYGTRRVSLHLVLVHEFLHAIYYQTQCGLLCLEELAQEDPSEAWCSSLSRGESCSAAPAESAGPSAGAKDSRRE